MKTFDLNRIRVLIGLACVALALYACGSQSDTPNSNGAAPGPNANLSNADLLQKAVGNMKALDSYHIELKGSGDGLSPEAFGMAPNTNIAGDMQSPDKGSRISMSDDANRTEYLIPAEGGHYKSYDGGKTWTRQLVDMPLVYLVEYYIRLWVADGNATRGEHIVEGLTLKDGDPAGQEIEGVHTRHMSAQAEASTASSSGGLSEYGQGARSISIWVSTKMTPTIRRMRIEGSNMVESTEAPYSLTWRWSRLNENFGEVKPTPAETVNSP